LTRREAATYAAGQRTQEDGQLADAGAESFDDFWQTYLRYHAQEGTRLLHAAGTGIGAAALLLGLLTINPVIVLAGTALGYLCAWTGHFLIEKNRPAMVSHPAWAFQCDIRMFRLWLTGQLGPELARAGVA
jgi:hypothetical protein